MTIRLVVADDHPVVRAGTIALLRDGADLDVVAEAADGREALARAVEHRPDVVLMDVRMPGVDGIEATARIRADARLALVRVLVMSAFDETADVLRAIAAGAAGYVLKDAGRDELLEAIRVVASGGSVLAPRAAERVMGSLRSASQPAPQQEATASVLTAREVEVLRLVAGGASNGAIAKKLRVSEATVKTHLLHLFPKLGVRDRTAAVTEALRRGILVL